ncbi:hypothetical protein niasHT_010372 [Heterodera trifolii]|uniref:BACK domain-containing protein n=1 Tax=Heterodera trifolii TaxID=157864 RepID=A0ABD2MBC7_9BILA
MAFYNDHSIVEGGISECTKRTAADWIRRQMREAEAKELWEEQRQKECRRRGKRQSDGSDENGNKIKTEKPDFGGSNDLLLSTAKYADLLMRAHRALLASCDVAFNLFGRFARIEWEKCSQSALCGIKIQCHRIGQSVRRFSYSNLSNVFAALSIARFNYLLKDFVLRCFAYIDKNVDDLLKSEGFLQIDQRLLCEILERDELQISGETTIWNAVISEIRN